MGTRAVIPATLLLLGLLAVVALASAGGRSSDGAAREAPPVFWDYLFSTAAVLVLLWLPFAIWLLAVSQRNRGRARSGKQRDIVVLVVVAAVCAGIALGVRLGIGPGLRGGATTQPVATAPSVTGPEADTTTREAEFKWLPAIVIGAAAILLGAYLQAKRRLRGSLEQERSEEALLDELAALLEDTLDDVRAEPDPRRAVIAAYARMERALAAFDLPRQAFEAPLEYLGRVAPELAEVPAAPRLVFELTHLYERAKFSAHEVDETMKQDAIGRLVSLRSELLERAA